MRPRTDKHTDTQTDRQTDTQTRVTTIHFASSTTDAKCNYELYQWRRQDLVRGGRNYMKLFVVHKTRAKDVLPNINRTQAAEITPGSDGMVPSAAAA